MSMRQIVILSGKGGTGKTSLVASLIPYFEQLVLADCDVDAPDLNILLEERGMKTEDFVGLQRPVLDADACTRCGRCHASCRFGAIDADIRFNLTKCEGCGVCEYVCPVSAIRMEDYVVGQVHESQTQFGPMVHARLIPGEETSGKLVAMVRERAKEAAERSGAQWVLIDGSPGIACNVISSLTGADKAVIVVEPTQSGLHDLERVHQLIGSFSMEAMVVINKSDLSEESCDAIEGYCRAQGLEVALKIPFHRPVVEAIVHRKIPSQYDPAFFDRIGFDRLVARIKA